MRATRTLLRSYLTGADGGAAVEFALVLPVLATFVFGIWFMGWALFCGSEVRHAVELGSRIYITNPTATSTDLQTAVTSHLADVSINDVTLNSSTVTISGASSQHITYSYQATAPIPFISAVNFNFSGSVDVPAASS